MAYNQIFLPVNIIFILFFSVLKIDVLGDKIEDSIYKKITGNSPCVMLLNATHQIGCTSKRKGNVGVVHYIDSDENFKWLLNEGKHTPYIPLFMAEYFTDDRLQQLINADKVSGALVLYGGNLTINGTNLPSTGFSPEYPCPNENFGLYSSNKKYSCRNSGSNSVRWNDNGSEMSYRDYGVPVFALWKTNEIHDLIKCYTDHNKPINGEHPDYPLCGVELLSFMFAAKDTPTCMRKGDAEKYTQNKFCDALGDKNVWGTLFPYYYHLTYNDFILATAKLDSTAFFHDIAPGADNDATGVVVLLAAAEVLGNATRNESIKPPDLQKNQKHIMFSFFHGEVWDYIGSSRMAYDMMNNHFPTETFKPSINLTRIRYFLELNQVGLLDNSSLWAHSDPVSDEGTRMKTKTMFNILSKFGASVNLSIENPSQSKPQPLPPASFQMFLKHNGSIPGLVIADHKATYTNKFYNSRFDDVPIQPFNVKRLTKLATTVARTLYQLAYNETKDDLVANEDRVNALLFCIVVNQNCGLFKQVVTKDNVKNLESQNGPMHRYVGPFQKQNGGVSGISFITKYLLGYFTGWHMNETHTCKSTSGYFVYKASNGTCINATVFYSDAQSPAFKNGDYDSTKYSTWTESRWGNDVGIRMFLIADPTQEAITLAVGIVLTLISIVVTFFMYQKAEQLFTPGDCLLIVNDDMQ